MGGWKAIVAFVAYSVGLGLLFAYANSSPRNPPVYSVFMFVGGWLGLAPWFVARIATANSTSKRRLPLSPRTLAIAATVFPCMIAWGGWTVRSTTTDWQRWPFFIVSVWTVSGFVTWTVAKASQTQAGDSIREWPRLRFSMFNLFLSIGCFAVAIAGAIYAIHLRNVLSSIDIAAMIALSPTSSIGIGGGVGALFNRPGRGLFLGLIFQFCQIPPAIYAGLWLLAG